MNFIVFCGTESPSKINNKNKQLLEKSPYCERIFLLRRKGASWPCFCDTKMGSLAQIKTGTLEQMGGGVGGSGREEMGRGGGGDEMFPQLELKRKCSFSLIS